MQNERSYKVYNKITLVGNLGQDPEIKTRSGADGDKKYAILSCATNRVVKGEKETDWHKVVVWDEKIADILERYTKKGSRVLLEGRMTYRKWENDAGETRVSAEVHLDQFYSAMKLMDSKSESIGIDPAPPKADKDIILDDEIPI